MRGVGLLLALEIFLALQLTASAITYVGESNTVLYDDFSMAWKYISMALSVGLSSLAAAYAVTKTGASAIGAMSEKPQVFGKTIVVVGLAEGIAIYGLLIALIIWIS